MQTILPYELLAIERIERIEKLSKAKTEENREMHTK
jgi:hypothetical protein